MKNRKIILVGVLLAVLVGLFFMLSEVQAGYFSIPDSGTLGLSNKTIAVILGGFLTWLLGIVGIIALIGFVVSGIQYILASGSEKGVESAKKNMTYSLIGITVALASYVVVKFIDSVLNATY